MENPKTIIELNCSIDDEYKFKKVLEAVFDIYESEIEIHDADYYASESDFANKITDTINEFRADDLTSDFMSDR